MNINLSQQLRPSRARGVALVMTIIILALITVMVLGFADLVRNETVSSATHQDRARAQFLSQMGVDIVTGVLRKQTANPDLVWASKPGALVIPNPSAAEPTRLAAQVALHSGYPTNPNATPNHPLFAPANLNIQTLADQTPPTHLITDQSADPDNPSAGAVKLPLRWVYVREDGQLDYAEAPAIGTSNPLVGRCAYWSDDESSKINLNTAWKRNAPGSSASASDYNKFSPSHPTAVNLASLTDPVRGITFTPEMADQVHAYITANHVYTDLGQPAGSRYSRFFNSLHELRALDQLYGTTGTPFTRAANAYKFELTHYNHDPDTTFFNEPRIVLTTQKMYAKGRPFLDILKKPGTDIDLGADPGQCSALDIDKLNTVLFGDPYNVPWAPGVEKKKLGLVDYLSREDWPVTTAGSSASFQKKYYGDHGNATTQRIRLTQLALNIIDYVRSAESERTLVEPIRGVISSGAVIGSTTYPVGWFVGEFHETGVRGYDNSYKGLTRSLYTTEMGVWISDGKETSGIHAGRYRYKFFMEVHLPEGGGVPQIDLRRVPFLWGKSAAIFGGGRLVVWLRPVSGHSSDNPATGQPDQRYYATGDDGAQVLASGRWMVVRPQNIIGDPIIREGEYRTIFFELYRNLDTRPSYIANMAVGYILHPSIGTTSPVTTSTGYQRYEITPVDHGIVRCAVDATETPENEIHSLQVADPFINNCSKDWRLTNTTPQEQNTLAGLAYPSPPSGPSGRNRPMAAALGSAPATAHTPPQDTDAQGRLTHIGSRLPYPKSHANNPSGIVYSPGELGHIHTGVEIRETAPKGGTPFRTLRLQPASHGPETVPDWAFMDLFTVPVDSTPQALGIFAPHGTGTGGRVNINAQVEPYANPEHFTEEADRLARRLPLVGMLAGAPSKTGTEDILSTSQARAIAANIYHRKWVGSNRFGHDGSFDSPGEIAEIQGVADQGEESEAVIRSIGNLITTRGSVFTVYSIGQTLRETRNGALLLTAEQRHQTMLERYLEIETDDNGTPDDPADDTPTKFVKFRRVLSRNLTP